MGLRCCQRQSFHSSGVASGKKRRRKARVSAPCGKRSVRWRASNGRTSCPSPGRNSGGQGAVEVSDIDLRGSEVGSEPEPGGSEGGEIGRASCRERVCQYV